MASYKMTRRPMDDYPTPGWCVDRLLEVVELPWSGVWLEPCAGEGRIIERVNAHHDGRWPAVRWHAWDIQERYRRPLEQLRARVEIGDMLDPVRGGRGRFDVVITNPPFALAMDVLLVARTLAPIVVLLLRRNFVASAKRYEYLSRNMPAEYLLPNRPSFVGGRTDSCEYAWMVWTPKSGPVGTTTMLALTPAAERNKCTLCGFSMRCPECQ